MASSVFRRPAMRWAVPAGVGAVVIAAGVTVPLIAGADAELPERTAAELLVDVAEADKIPLAGTVVQSADVGLPEIPGLVGAPGEAGDGTPAGIAASLLSGSTTARVWYSDESTFRVALQDELAENDVIRDGDDLWFWSSEGNTVQHLSVPADATVPDPRDLPHAAGTPADLADLALGAVAGSTEVDVDGTATVAGRPAYELVVSPTAEESLIGSVRLAIDAENSVPLRVQVYDDDGGDPAVEVGFTSVSFDEPDRSVYEFTPPEGATVEEVDPGALPDRAEHDDKLTQAAPSVVGESWTSVLVLRGIDLTELTAGSGGDAPDQQVTQDMIDALLAELTPVSGPYGSGVAMQSDLFSAMLLDDGRLLMGAVTLEALEAAAQDPAAAVDAPSTLDLPAPAE